MKQAIDVNGVPSVDPASRGVGVGGAGWWRMGPWLKRAKAAVMVVVNSVGGSERVRKGSGDED